MSEIIEKELSYLVNGCIFDVHNEVGPGLREECYQKAMEIGLAQAGLPFIAKPRTRRELVFLGEVAAVFEPDLLVSDRLILELKAHAEGMPVAFFRQTINYLKCWGFELGLLVNFADARADIRRVVFHEHSTTPQVDFDSVRDTIPAKAREMLTVVSFEMLLEKLDGNNVLSIARIKDSANKGYKNEQVRLKLVGLNETGGNSRLPQFARPVRDVA